MHISKRLLTVGNMVPDGAYVLDVGADHGLLERYLLLNRDIKYIVAIDNKDGPHKILKETLHGLRKVEVRKVDGLSTMSPDVDTIVLAGLGGKNIISILDAHKRKLYHVQTIIVDAHTFTYDVKKYLHNLKFFTSEEKLVFEDGKFYNIIRFEKSNQKRVFSKDSMEIGYHLKNDPLFEKYQAYLIEKTIKEIDKIKCIDSKKDRYEYLVSFLERVKNYGKSKTI